jgi:hypothetical protein
MEVPRSDFIKEYIGIRNKVFTPDLIQSAWKKAGIWPMDPKRFTEKDFAPSKLMSYTASLPPGYPEPTDVPDMLVHTQGNDESEEGGDRCTRPVTRNEMHDSDEVDEESGDDESVEMGEHDDEDDGTDDGTTEGERDDGNNDQTAGEDGTNMRREEPATVDEVSEDATVGRTDMLSDMATGRLSRYEIDSPLEQLIFTYPRSSTPLSTPPAFISSYERAQIEDLEEEVRSLRSQLETANSQLEAAVAHSVCAGWEIKSLKERLNSKTNTKKRKVQVNAQYISSAEAARILEEQDREEAEKQQREEEAQAAKKAKDDQRKQQCEAGGLTFIGSLNSKTKDDLLDVAFALRLTGSDSNSTETRAALISMINDHLDKNPHLASNPTFAGLFLSRTRGRKRNDENATPSTILPPAPLSPGLPRQPLSPDFADNASDPELEPQMVLFSELPPSGRFFQSINSTPPDFSLPGPSSFVPYVHYPPPISHPADPQFLPPFYPPPPSHG